MVAGWNPITGTSIVKIKHCEQHTSIYQTGLSGTSFVIVRWLFRNCETYPDQVSEQQDADDGVEDDPQDTKRRSPGQAGERVLRERG